MTSGNMTTGEHTNDTEQRVTLITGGSRGIGAATALRLAADHPDVAQVLSYANDKDAAAAVADQVREAGVTVEIKQADVAEEQDVLSLFSVVDSLGSLTGLVNNAGLLFPVGRLDGYDYERIARTMAVNVTGAMLCARESVKRMSTANGGAGGNIVNVSSRAASFGSPNEFIDYAASKGAVDTMTVGLATEVAREGIRVNAVRPGLIDTDIHASAGVPDRVELLSDRIPMGRGGTAEEVAATIAWLLSDDSSYVTGALLDVGGGR